ncbi:unnamed protein product [Linum tenue]|uniref:Serine incorporator n=1 Tax=Linum tenue TaxID=586396 RepID=A0AAV0HX70_9ROSI|nr:unnamed protein product [Linum tenue]
MESAAGVVVPAGGSGSASSRIERNNAVLKDPSWFGQFRNGSNPWMARYVYALIFLSANLLAWAARDYGHSALTEMERLKVCDGKSDCLGVEGVLRVSLGCFVFFILMFLLTLGTSKLQDPRDAWHSGWWSAKIAIWVGVTLLAFLLPSTMVRIYGEIAHFGAGVFLLIQLVSVISFITWINDRCLSEKNAERCHIHVMVVATGSYVISLINAGFLAPGLMGLYVVFLCWCAIRRQAQQTSFEPAGEICNRKAEASKRTDWLTIISFVIGLLAIVIATFSTGIDSQCFQKSETQGSGENEEDEVPYGYGFFHFVFATGAMYFAMLLIGWNTHHAIKKWTIDVGWTSAWVRIVNEWLAVCVYVWMLVAPIILKSRRAGGSPPV